MNDRIGCIFITVVTGILFTPFQVLYCFPLNNTKLNWINISLIVFISVLIVIFGIIEIIKTNNPVSRFNPFPTKEDLRNNKIDKIIK